MQSKIIKTAGIPLSALAFAVLLSACGSSGGGGDDTNDTVESSSLFSESSSDSSVSSEVSSSSESSESSSVQTVRSVTVSDAYILEANVSVGGRLADIRLANGVYEWVDMPQGELLSVGGANDLGEPKNLATETDPNAYPMGAPEGYSHINPFTTMIVMGGYDPATDYPAAAAVAGENGLQFNYDVVKAGDVAAGGDLAIAKEVAKAALRLAALYPPVSSSSSSSVSSVAVSSTAASSSSYANPGESDPFPAAARASVEDVYAEIDQCTDNECIDAILLREMMLLRGAYQPECELLPGEEECTGGGTSSSEDASASVSDSSSSTVNSSSSTAYSSVSNPFPS